MYIEMNNFAVEDTFQQTNSLAMADPGWGIWDKSPPPPRLLCEGAIATSFD